MFLDVHTLDGTKSNVIPYVFEQPIHGKLQNPHNSKRFGTCMTKLKLDKEVGGGDLLNSGIVCLVLLVVWFACVVCFVCFVLIRLVCFVCFVCLFVLFCL